MSRVRPSRAVLLVVLALLAALVAVGSGQPAHAADEKGLANGAIKFGQHDSPGIKMLWFDRSWHYLGQKRANGGGYSVWLAPGTYHLQFVDQRPAYDVTKYAPTDIEVTVRADDITTKNVAMRPGAAITGTAVAGGRPLAGARLVAANKGEQSFSTTANKKGQFAIGGLPQGKYSVFTYDKHKAWVGKSTWAGAVKPGRPRNLAVKLTKRAGSMTVYLFTPDGRLRTRTAVTVTSRATGQWWTATASNGTAVFRGLYPGAYTLKFDGAGVWLPRTGAVARASVKQGTMSFGKFDITKRGGWVTGDVVDAAAPAYLLKGAQVLLFDKAGRQVDTATTGDDGQFRLEGQLTTQSGMTIVVHPDPNSGGWMQSESYCLFSSTDVSDVSVTSGEESFVGDIELPRSDASGQPDHCRVD